MLSFQAQTPNRGRQCPKTPLSEPSSWPVVLGVLGVLAPVPNLVLPRDSVIQPIQLSPNRQRGLNSQLHPYSTSANPPADNPHVGASPRQIDLIAYLKLVVLRASSCCSLKAALRGSRRRHICHEPERYGSF